MPKSICFTGHRRIPKDAKPILREKLRTELERAIQEGYTDFYAGGALGWDTMCAEMVLELREKYPQITLRMILPCSPYDQTLNWTEEQQNTYHSILERADDWEYVAIFYTKNCMKLRNQRLVDCADKCIAYCTDEAGRTGTAQTVRMARKKGIDVVILTV